MTTNLTFLQQFALWAQIGFFGVSGISLAATGILAAADLLSSIYHVSLEASTQALQPRRCPNWSSREAIQRFSEPRQGGTMEWNAAA